MTQNLTALVHDVEAEAPTYTLSPRLLIDCLDLTELGSVTTEKNITALCDKALTHHVAAVCVHPVFVRQSKTLLTAADKDLQSHVRVATVANFPSGTDALPLVLKAIEESLKQGAEELDVVIPYQAYLENKDPTLIKNFVLACKSLLPNQCLKIILESGALYTPKLLELAALASLEGGAEFLKTSTGKGLRGASLADAAIMIRAIQNFGDSNRGFKASGGVRDTLSAKKYYLLAERIMGNGWPNKNNFRLGASSLLDDLLTTASHLAYL